MVNHKAKQVITDENSSLCLAALSVIGDRDDQQDSFGYDLKQNRGLIVVCDGMGGLEGGKAASELAVKTFLEQTSTAADTGAQAHTMIRAVKTADAKIARLENGAGDLLRAGSTLVSVAVNRNELMWCSVGDSRAYLLRNGELVQFTQDHNYQTVLEEKRLAGLLSEADYRRESARGEALISFLGMGNLSLIDYSETPLALMKEDKLLIVSDGLYKMVTDFEIARILDNFNNIGEAVQALEMKAQKNAKNSGDVRDNTTIVLVKIK